MSQFPSTIQVCLLFDRANPVDLEALVARFQGEELPVSYKLVFDTKPGVFYRLFGQNEVMATLEYIDRPTNPAHFNAALTAPFVTAATPDARERIAAHTGYVLVNVHHGALPPQGEIGDLLRKLDIKAGADLGSFKQRLRIAARLGALVCEMGRPSLVHWTPTDHLLREDAFRLFAAEPIPSLLHFQPLPFGASEDAQGRTLAGIDVFGATHFLARDIRVAPSFIPWVATLDPIIAFLRLATVENGYVVPDGDTFSPADGSFTFRARHLRAGPRFDGTQGPIIELEPLDYPEHGFRSADFIAPTHSFDDRAVPPVVSARLGQTGASVVADWRKTRRMAEAAGSQLRIKYDPEKIAPARPSALRRLLKVVTGGR